MWYDPSRSEQANVKGRCDGEWDRVSVLLVLIGIGVLAFAAWKPSAAVHPVTTSMTAAAGTGFRQAGCTRGSHRHGRADLRSLGRNGGPTARAGFYQGWLPLQ